MARSKRFLKRRVARFGKYRIHTMFVVLVLIGMAVVLWPAFSWSNQLDGQVQQLSVEKNRLTEKNQALIEEARRLQSPDYVEQLARQELGLVKPGEVPIAPGAATKP